MNRKQLLLVLVALAFIGSAGLILVRQHKQSWTVRSSRLGDKALPDFKYNDVAAVHVKGSSEFNVIRTNGGWRVPERGGYAANFQQLKNLLLKLKDLKVVQADKIGPSQLGRIDLNEPGKSAHSGILLEFRDSRGALLGALLAGKLHMRPHTDPNEPAGLHGLFDGRYILLPSDPTSVLLVSDDLPTISAEPGPWLDHDFFKIENLQSITLTSPNPADSWRLTRENESAPWSLADLRVADGEVLHAAKASEMPQMLGFLNFTDVIPPGTPAPNTSTGSEKSFQLVAQSFDHFTYALNIAPGGEETYRFTVAVTADIPSQRVAGKDETPEQKLKLDQDFQEKTKALREKLTHEQTLSQWAFLGDAKSINVLLRTRPQLLEKKSIVANQ